MRCAACDIDNLVSAKFCEACGAKLGMLCPRCGHGNRPVSRFCVECGGQLAAATPAADRDVKSRTLAPSRATRAAGLRDAPARAAGVHVGYRR